MCKKNYLQLARLVETEHMTIGLCSQNMNIDKHIFCMEVLNRGKVTTHVGVFVTWECIHLYISCIVPLCLFQEVSIM